MLLEKISISNFGVGGILLGTSALLMIPTTMGLAAYANNDRENKTNQTKFYEVIQAIMLALAVLGFLLGGTLMVTNARTGVMLNVGTGTPAVKAPPTKPAALGGRRVTDFELF